MKNFFLLSIIISIFISIFDAHCVENDLDPKNYTNKAEIIIIDKTSENYIKPFPVLNKDQILNYKNLEITLESCWKSPKIDGEHAALILVNEIIPEQKKIVGRADIKNAIENKFEIENAQIKKVFHGWIFSKDRAASHLNHEVYQIYLSKCVS
jgi:hypothetical protein